MQRIYEVNDLRKYLKCPRYYYLSKQYKVDYIPYASYEDSLIELVCKKLGISEYYLGSENDSAKRFFNEFDNYEWFLKARLKFRSLEVKVTVIHKRKDKELDIYLVMFLCKPKITDTLFYLSHIWVLEKLGFKIGKIKILYLNEGYKRGAFLDLDELFILSEEIYDHKTHEILNVREIIMSNQYNIYRLIKEIQSHELADFKALESDKCKGKSRCEMYDKCFDEDKIADNSILTLSDTKKKEYYLKMGFKTLKDLDVNFIKASKRQLAQIKADLNGGRYINQQELKQFLDKIIYPISFIDFEWETYLIPPYEGLKPYSALCFAYSLHILDKDGNLTHYDFISKGDTRKEFVDSLIERIPKQGSIIAFNAKGAEELRLKELADYYKEKATSVYQLIDRLIDLAHPFSEGLIYDLRMKGKYNLKILLSIASDLSYDDLNIRDGLQAVDLFRKLDNLNDKRISELKEYYTLDTYSMYLVYKWILSLTE